MAVRTARLNMPGLGLEGSVLTSIRENTDLSFGAFLCKITLRLEKAVLSSSLSFSTCCGDKLSCNILCYTSIIRNLFFDCVTVFFLGIKVFTQLI